MIKPTAVRRARLLAAIGALGISTGRLMPRINCPSATRNSGGTIPFSRTQVAGARKAMEEWKAKGVDIDLIVTNGGNTDTTRQVADLEDLHTQGINGLLLFPGDSIVLAEPVKTVFNANHIPVVVTDIGLQSGSSFIITDNVTGSRQAAQLMAKNVKPGAKVIVFDFGPANYNVQARVRGFETEAKARGLTVLPRKVIKLSLEEDRRTMSWSRAPTSPGSSSKMKSWRKGPPRPWRQRSVTMSSS